MPVPAPDRALRRLVARLAEAAPEDVEAILDGLDENHRGRARTLLRDYLGAPPAPEGGGQSAPAVAELPGLSPWLSARLAQSAGAIAAPAGSVAPAELGPGPGPTSFTMTRQGLAALQTAAAALHATLPPPPTATTSRRLGWARLIRRAPWA